jgi:hypothetical protein
MDNIVDAHIPNRNAQVASVNILKQDQNDRKINIPILPSIIIGCTVLSVVLILFYFLFAYPRLNSTRITKKQKEITKELLTSIRNIRASLDNIKIITNEEWQIDTPLPLETSGLIIHPNLASILNEPDILGISVSPNIGVVENTVQYLQSSSKNIMMPVILSPTNVAGIQTVAENPFISQLRMLIDETNNTDGSAKKAQTDLDQLVENAQESNKFITEYTKVTLADTAKVDEKTRPYLEEALKISSYYQILADTLIRMNDKIISFKQSIQAAGNVLNVENDSANFVMLQSQLKQAKVYVDQATKDTHDIKISTDNLKNIPLTHLPMSASQYHQHNIGVIESVTDYFTEISKYTNEMLAATDVVLTKMQSGNFTPNDLLIFQNSIVQTVQNSSTADTKFTSNLQSLINEEQSLTMSFWQNNTLISQGGDVEGMIDLYDKNLTKILSDSKIPIINN